MDGSKAYEAEMASGTGFRSILSDPLALATKPAVIFKFVSSVSMTMLNNKSHINVTEMSYNGSP